MSTAAVSQTRAPRSSAAQAISTHSPSRAAAEEASERNQLLDRLSSLRRVLPILAQEMAAARRQAAHLRIDNRRLTDQVRKLRAELEARDHRPG